jgi:hypothetical protein
LKETEFGDVAVDVDNIKTGLKGTDCKGLEWIQTVQDRIQRRGPVKMEMNHQFLQKEQNFLTS